MFESFIANIDRIGVVAGALVAIFTAYLKLLRPPIKRAWGAVDLVMQELQPNGGASMRDELKRIDRGIARLTEQQRAQLDCIVDCAVFETDEVGKYRFVNRRYSEVVGRPREALMGHGWVNSLHPDTRYQVARTWQEAVKQGRAFDETLALQTPDGEDFEAHVVAEPVRARGDLIGYLGRLQPS